MTRGSANAVAPSIASPFSRSGALVCSLAAVVETEGAVAGVAAKREEVELPAVGILAVGADGFEVFVFEHGEGLVWGWLGGHDGQLLAGGLYVW